MKTRKQNMQGISLIVLVITIIVMIILATAVVLTLSNSGIISKANDAVEATDLANVQDLASMLWADVYLDETIPKENIEAEVIERLSNSGVDVTKYNIDVTLSGVTVTLAGESNVPTEWQAYVSNVTEDGVPIPKGFVASQVDGENTKAVGLVIYEGTTPVTDANVDDARENRNQFVWVPVDKDTFSTTDTQFKRTDYKNNPSKVMTDGKYNNLGTTNVFWELELAEDNMPKGKTLLSDWALDGDLDYISDYTITEAQSMYASVKKYGGFYIARYEVGAGNTAADIDNTTKFARGDLSITMGKYPYNGVKWGTSIANEVLEGGAVTLARSFYPNSDTNTTGVISTLTYGVQWDRTLDWIKSIKGESFSLTNSSEYGNYSNTTLSKEEFNPNAQYVSAKSNSSSATAGYYDVETWTDATKFTTRNGNYIMTTGALQKANLCNIYDIAGNMGEWTMEGYSSNSRVVRGGDFDNFGTGRTVSYRGYDSPTFVYAGYGFRPSLYIK